MGNNQNLTILVLGASGTIGNKWLKTSRVNLLMSGLHPVNSKRWSNFVAKGKAAGFLTSMIQKRLPLLLPVLIVSFC